MLRRRARRARPTWGNAESRTRWNASRGRHWGAAAHTVDTGTCDPHDMNSIGYRSAVGMMYLGAIAERYTVRQGGCHSCPIRCMTHLNVPSVATKYGMSPQAANTCGGWGPRAFFPKFPDGSQGMGNLEAAVVGRPDAMKGQALVAFVTVKGGVHADGDLREELRQHVAKVIGPVAKPDDIRFAEALPKTRSGKLMRRLLKEIAAGSNIHGDITTLEDISVLARLTHEEE